MGRNQQPHAFRVAASVDYSCACRTVDPAVFGYVLPLVATAPNEAGLGGKALFANKLFECFWDASLRQTVLANVAQTLGHLGDCLMLLACQALRSPDCRPRVWRPDAACVSGGQREAVAPPRSPRPWRPR